VEKDLRDIGDSPLNIDQFRMFAKSHQALLFPAFQMQSALQRKVLGYKFWEKNANRRIKFSNGKYVSIGKTKIPVRRWAVSVCSVVVGSSSVQSALSFYISLFSPNSSPNSL
jgi:hypothetical protein